MIEALYVNTSGVSLIKLGLLAINSRNAKCIPTYSSSDEKTLKEMAWIKVGGKAMVVWDDEED